MYTTIMHWNSETTYYNYALKQWNHTLQSYTEQSNHMLQLYTKIVYSHSTIVNSNSNTHWKTSCCQSQR